MGLGGSTSGIPWCWSSSPAEAKGKKSRCLLHNLTVFHLHFQAQSLQERYGSSSPKYPSSSAGLQLSNYLECSCPQSNAVETLLEFKKFLRSLSSIQKSIKNIICSQGSFFKSQHLAFLLQFFFFKINIDVSPTEKDKYHMIPLICGI